MRGNIGAQMNVKRTESKVKCCCCNTTVGITDGIVYNNVLCLSCYFEKELER